MEQYSYHEETGKITLEKKAVQNSENAGKSIYLMRGNLCGKIILSTA